MKMLVFLADTVHRSNRLYPDTVPYNVARIAAYAQSHHSTDDYRLFKDPNRLLDGLRSSRPEVLALSNYFWNTQLNHRIARYARDLYPDILIVTGGPNLDRNRDAYIRYSVEYPFVDLVVVEEGETAFSNILTALHDSGGNRAQTKARNIAGTFAILRAGDVRMSDPLQRVKSLDEFPSPYLNGMLSPFLAMGLRPILETVRGCPYQCAFCEQGSEFFTKIARLSESRVFCEIDYIHERTSAPELILADVNFGILKRDYDVACYLKQLHQEDGWPKTLYVYNAKQPTDTTLQTMETLYPMAQLCMSFQSTDERVLNNIHRSNIGYDKYSFITRWAKSHNIRVGTELIYGLPGETRESFVRGYDALLEFRADYMASYTLRLFAGIELNTPAKRQEYAVRTRFRPIDANLGEYQFEGRERIMEIEEVVYETSTLTEEDFFFARRLGFMIEAFWNTGYLRPALVFLANHGFKVTDVLQAILSESHASPAAPFFEEYDRLAHDELAFSPADFRKRLIDDNYWDDLVNGRGNNVRLNLAFAGWLILFENPFDKFFYNFLERRYAEKLPVQSRNAFRDILAHCQASKVDIDRPEPRQVEMLFDVPEWVRAAYPKDLSAFILSAPVKYTYAVAPYCHETAVPIRKHLERQGARIYNIAERIFAEQTLGHRGLPRAAIRSEAQVNMREASSGDLEKRMSWLS
jgi:radical SAM superfamily enzyme YgiQ (UPF0313 family)